MKTVAFASAVTVATATPGPSSLSGDAFRRLLDREQVAALNRFRTVPGDAGGPSARDSRAKGHVRSASHGVQAQETAPRSIAKAATGLAGAPSDRSGNIPRFTPAGIGSSGPSAALAACPMSSTTPHVDAPSGTAAPDSAAEVLEAALRARFIDTAHSWPLRKLHCRLEEDGIHVWLRDSAQQTGDAALDASIAALRQALRDAGYRLAGFTLNGIRLI